MLIDAAEFCRNFYASMINLIIKWLKVFDLLVEQGPGLSGMGS